MRLVNVGLKYFEDPEQLEAYVTALAEDGTRTDIKLSDLLDVASATATAKARRDIGEQRLK